MFSTQPLKGSAYSKQEYNIYTNKTFKTFVLLTVVCAENYI